MRSIRSLAQKNSEEGGHEEEWKIPMGLCANSQNDKEKSKRTPIPHGRMQVAMRVHWGLQPHSAGGGGLDGSISPSLPPPRPNTWRGHGGSKGAQDSHRPKIGFMP